MGGELPQRKLWRNGDFDAAASEILDETFRNMLASLDGDALA
jgi:hypothetical protein